MTKLSNCYHFTNGYIPQLIFLVYITSKTHIDFLNWLMLQVDCIVTTAGGIEEDFIKCLAPTFMGDFHLDGKTLRECGINRIGNLLVPNDNYCSFENWIMPILDDLLKEQNDGVFWTPSKIVERLGKEINNEESIYYWASKNKIPVFCPALTDGSLGDMMFLHSFRNPGLVVDILAGRFCYIYCNIIALLGC